jgi:hypothetical protein
MFSFPPENLLTLLAPNFFGDGKESQYWGRSYLWEMSLFVGVTGLVMAVVGADQNHEEGTRRGRQEARGKRIAKGIWLWVVGHRELVMVGILFVLALGAHTPLFKALYHWVPGFDKFRGSSKFIFLASMFLALLAGMGLDRLARGWRPTRAFIAGTGAGALMLLLAGLWARQAGEVVLASAEPPGETIGARSMSGWHKLMLAVRETDEIYLARATYQDASFVSKSARVASKGLLVGAGTLAIVVSLLAYQRMRGGRVVIWLLVLAVAELVVFGRQSLDSFDLRTTQMPEVAGTLAKHPGDYRILNLVNPNVAMTIGGEDVWGDDPGSLLRCAELLAFTQGQNPDTVSQYLTIGRQHPLFDLLRCRVIFAPGDGKISIYENGRAFPRLVLAPAFKVLKSRDEIFGAMTNAAFNPTEEVILEREPAGGSQKSEAKSQERRNEAKVVDSGTDWMAIEAESKQASILLITDAYAKGWRAQALEGSSQRKYEVLPADYCLRAIPLEPGHHRLKLQYLPTGFVVGKWVSVVTGLAFLGLVGAWGKGKFRWVKGRSLKTEG